MKNRIAVGLSIFIVGLFLLGSIQQLFEFKTERSSGLSQEIISVPHGFGYEIFNGEKLIVKQEFIPALEGRTPFKSPGDAKKVAKLVMEKMKNGTSPRIDFEELVDLGIVDVDR